MAAWLSVKIVTLVSNGTASNAVQMAASSARVDDGQIVVYPLKVSESLSAMIQPNPMMDTEEGSSDDCKDPSVYIDNSSRFRSSSCLQILTKQKAELSLRGRRLRMRFEAG